MQREQEAEMNSFPNREKVFKGYDDDSYVYRVSDGKMGGPEPKRQNETRTDYKRRIGRDVAKLRNLRSHRGGLIEL